MYVNIVSESYFPFVSEFYKCDNAPTQTPHSPQVGVIAARCTTFRTLKKKKPKEGSDVSDFGPCKVELLDHTYKAAFLRNTHLQKWKPRRKGEKKVKAGNYVDCDDEVQSDASSEDGDEESDETEAGSAGEIGSSPQGTRKRKQPDDDLPAEEGATPPHRYAPHRISSSTTP
jgi:hypothetical protein